MTTKTIDNICIRDFQSNTVWKFCRGGGMEIAPVLKLPCKSLNGRIVGTQVGLADGTKVWGMLSNIDTDNPSFSKHFLTLSIRAKGRWFHLARYHDYDYNKRGPKQLAQLLGKPVNKVFPIVFDIRHVFNGESAALCGTIKKVPSEKLTRDAIIAMAVPKVSK